MVISGWVGGVRNLLRKCGFEGVRFTPSLYRRGMVLFSLAL